MVFRGRHPRIQPLSALPNVLQIYAWFLLNSHFMEPAVHTSCYNICFFGLKRSLAYFCWYQLNRSKMDDTWYHMIPNLQWSLPIFLCSPQKRVKTSGSEAPMVSTQQRPLSSLATAQATLALDGRDRGMGGTNSAPKKVMSLGSHLGHLRTYWIILHSWMMVNCLVTERMGL